MGALMRRSYISMDDSVMARPSEEQRKMFDEVGEACLYRSMQMYQGISRYIPRHDGPRPSKTAKGLTCSITEIILRRLIVEPPFLPRCSFMETVP